MRIIKNSYFRAIAKVTDNGKFPEYSDLWRSYHSFACMFDSDYSLFTEIRFFSRADSLLFSSELESSQAVFGVPREERSGAVQNRALELYVPVTRKVSSRSRKNVDDLIGRDSFEGDIQEPYFLKEIINPKTGKKHLTKVFGRF